MNSTKKKLAVGIDLGTTYSVVAYLNATGRPETVPNTEGDLLTPSLVMIDGAETIIGKEAAKAMSTDLKKIAESPKRQVGQRVYDKVIEGRRYPPEAFQAWILHKLCKDASTKIGEFDKAVVTVPAYFDEVRRKSTQDAGYIAGLDVIDIINEPTAAAVAYGVKQGFLNEQGKADQKIRALVYDLGGGTFDVTVMEIHGDQFRTIATDGDYKLGGRDWDNRLVDYCASEFIREHGLDPREFDESLGRMLRDCQDAKETLSTRDKASISCACGNKSKRIEVTKEQFEEMTIDLVERTAFTTRSTLQAAKMTWNDIDRVLLVGGSTRMPMVREMLMELSGKKLDESLSPDEAVAHGAAIRAGILLDDLKALDFKPRIKNVNSHSLGVIAKDIETGEGRVVTIIPRNTQLPVVGKRVFKTHRPDQESILVQIVEGESPAPQHCSQVGRCSIWDIPEKLPVGTPVEVSFGYQENGRLQVTVQVGDHNPFKQEIQRPNSMTQEQLDSWRGYICGEETE